MPTAKQAVITAEGNGARKALIEALGPGDRISNPEGYADYLLAALWADGFKVVPLERADEIDAIADAEPDHA